MATLIRRIGRCGLRADTGREPFESLVRAIAHQQLHGRAAEAILGRFSALFPGGDFPHPDAVMATADAALRGCGFSAGKVAAIRDICAKALDGTVPTRRQSHRLSNDALIERLTTIRVLHGLDAQPKPKALAEIGQAWAPYRSVATWYLYRAADEARRQGPQSRA